MANNLGVNSYTVGGDYDLWGDKFVADLAILNKFAGDTHTVGDTSGTVTLDVEDCQNFSIRANGGTASQVDIRVPDSIARYWYVRNDRASGAITVRCAAGGTSVTLSAGDRRLVYSDGTNCVDLTLVSIAIASVTGLQAALDAKQPLDSDLTAIAALTTASYGRSLLTLANATALAAEVDSFFLTPTEGNAAYQPLDSDLTAIAALTTTSYGRSYLAMANAAAVLSDLGLTNAAKLDTADQTVTGGARVTSLSLGTPSAASTVTLDPGDRPLQHLTNNAAFTLAPGSNSGSIILDITNGASAGVITTSGFTKVIGAFTTTNGHKFRCVSVVGNAGSTLTIQAMQ